MIGCGEDQLRPFEVVILGFERGKTFRQIRVHPSILA
jgi:hypothetical protein